VVSAIRLQLHAYEQAWNRGDIPAVVSQYSPSLVAILNSTFYDYPQYTGAVEQVMSKPDRNRMSIEIQTIRAFDTDCGVANGRVHLRSNAGTESVALFTVIYKRFTGRWKIIYSHS
jgi:ketosteroid isomerase-like protein